MGGAIWEWEDQGLWNRRDPKRPYIAYGGGFGEKPNDEYFIHKGVVFSDRSPKPHFPEVKRAYQWIAFKDLGGGKVMVKNRFAFTDLSKYDLKWTVVSDDRHGGDGRDADAVASRRARSGRWPCRCPSVEGEPGRCATT